MKKKQKDKSLDNLPICAVEYINLVIKLMRYRPKVREDVRAELAAHFEDALKDCRADEEKEKKAQKLIAEFGDAKILAILTRRAKKRCRPFWRTVAARTFQTIGVLILCFIIYTAWFLTGKPVITTDYITQLNTIACPLADDSLNASPLYHKAAKSVENLPDDIKEVLRKRRDEVSPDQKQLIEKWLTDNKETLQLAISGTQKPHYWQKYEEGKEGEGMMSVLMPHLAEFRRLVYALRWRIWLNAEQGRYQAAFDDIKSSYRLGQHLRSGKSTIEQLVAIAIEAVALQTLRDILDEHQFDSATLATLQQDFEQMVADEDFTVNIKTEKLLKYDEIQRCFTKDRFGCGHLYLPRLISITESWTEESQYPLPLIIYGTISSPKNWTVALKVLFAHPNKQETEEMVEHLYDYWERIIHKTPAQIQAEGIGIEEEAMKIIEGNILLEILLPAYQRVHQISYRVPTEVNATLAIIATLRYMRKTGSYPDNLNELVTAGYLKQLPMDPYSDKPLVYKKTEDGFTLYSVGQNFIDDGGKSGKDEQGKARIWADNGDAVFWPVTQ